jgi:hypothetical protein
MFQRPGWYRDKQIVWEIRISGSSWKSLISRGRSGTEVADSTLDDTYLALKDGLNQK